MVADAPHISVRVPWHDRGWRGEVCAAPGENEACLALDRIRATREDAWEEENAGVSWHDLPPDRLPPCARERGNFMADKALVIVADHPYAGSSDVHRHLQPTPLRMPAYSAACVPFRWMLRDEATVLAEELEIDFDDRLEEAARDLMGFNSEWVQDGINQKAMLDAFFDRIELESSLCLIYAKRVPLSEESGKVLIGAGRVLHVGDVNPYRNSDAGPFGTLLWERMVQHSIRPDFEDGFLLPYQEVLAASAHDGSIDTEAFVARVPDEAWHEFSHGSERVGNDSAIAALVACRQALEVCAETIPGSRAREFEWIDRQLARLWSLRGPCPGLGAALTAFGVTNGTLLVHRMASIFEQGSDPWEILDQAFRDPGAVLSGLDEILGPSLRAKWDSLAAERKALLKLVSRFELSPDQAERLYQPSERKAAGIDATDAQLLEDPYLFYLLDRHSPDAIPIGTVDRGAFPDGAIRERHPIAPPSRMDDALDGRRVRGLLASLLERQAAAGNSLATTTELVGEMRRLPLDPPCPLDQDQMAIQDYTPFVLSVKAGEGEGGLQLDRLSQAAERISKAVEKRRQGRPHEVSEDWPKLLQEQLPAASDPDEARAREEKAAALSVLAAGRISVLVGAAGTGKTTLLDILCRSDEIRAGGSCCWRRPARRGCSSPVGSRSGR